MKEIKNLMQDRTIQYYKDNAGNYVKQTVNADMGGTYVDFLAYIPQGGRILDVGFGSGRDLAYFSKQGYLAHGIDLVEEFGIIEVCRTGIVALKRGNGSILNEN
jgi:2-polyprenyl-3-methyl-5-hydroxy-6-metoxy-1,4-benzoquinol methylase